MNEPGQPNEELSDEEFDEWIEKMRIPQILESTGFDTAANIEAIKARLDSQEPKTRRRKKK